MRNYGMRIWQDGDGHWVVVTDPARREIARVWNHGSKAVARQEGRDAIAADQAKARTEAAAVAS